MNVYKYKRILVRKYMSTLVSLYCVANLRIIIHTTKYFNKNIYVSTYLFIYVYTYLRTYVNR